MLDPPASTLCSGRNAQVDADLTDAQPAHQCNATVLRVPGIPMPIARYHLPCQTPGELRLRQYACAVKASMFITAIPPGAGFTGLKSAEVQSQRRRVVWPGTFKFPTAPTLAKRVFGLEHDAQAQALRCHTMAFRKDGLLRAGHQHRAPQGRRCLQSSPCGYTRETRSICRHQAPHCAHTDSSAARCGTKTCETA